MLYRIEGGKESQSLPAFYAIDFLNKLALQLHCSVPVPDFYSNKKSVPIASSFLIWNRMKHGRKNMNKHKSTVSRSQNLTMISFIFTKFIC